MEKVWSLNCFYASKLKSCKLLKHSFGIRITKKENKYIYDNVSFKNNNMTCLMCIYITTSLLKNLTESALVFYTISTFEKA